MELNKDNYTKEEVQEMLKGYDAKIQAFTTKLNDSNLQLENLDKQQKQIESLTKSNLESSIKVEMLKNGLSEDMFDLVADSTDIESASNKINKLLELKKKSDIDNGYKPQEHTAQQTAYEEAQKKNDVTGMLKAKMSKLFK